MILHSFHTINQENYQPTFRAILGQDIEISVQDNWWSLVSVCQFVMKEFNEVV